VKYLPRGINFSNSPGLVARPVFGVDVDGTLGDYHTHFLRFAAGWLGVEDWPGPPQARGACTRWPHDSYYGECSLAQFMGVSKTTYRRIKLAYRQGGLKRSMPAYAGASELTRALRATGAEVWLCTTRPFLAVNGVEPDTREWLRRNRIQCDGVLAGEHKYRDLVKTVGKDRIVAVLDDLPEMLLQAEALGLTAVLMGAPHNNWTDWVEHNGEGEALWTGWYPEGAALKMMLELLEKWKGQRA
jgi:phosphoglycolate phosphatase-like HAD superfamily hydrolase